MFLITEKDVNQISCEKIGRRGLGEAFRVTLHNEDEYLMKQVEVEFTYRILDKLTEEDKLNYAARSGARAIHSGERIVHELIGSHNFESFQGERATDDQIDNRLRILIRKFFKKYPKMALSPTDLFVSTNFKFHEIVDRLGYFEARGILRKSTSTPDEDTYELAYGGFDKLEALERTEEGTAGPENRYFQLVSLSNKVKEPFVFVLMPFKSQEFDQKVYSDVIKPIVEKELGICCIRSDEETKPGVINNQIYTMIRKAKLIIAETTSRNPNVFYEVGMAHAFNKDVFIFNSSKKNKKLPFDIITNRAVFYDDYEDLKKKIVENLRDHVS
jgi:hypothetical protein